MRQQIVVFIQLSDTDTLFYERNNMDPKAYVEFMEKVWKNYETSGDDDEAKTAFLQVFEYLCKVAALDFYYSDELENCEDCEDYVKPNDDSECFQLANRAWSDVKYQCNDTNKVMFLKVMQFLHGSGFNQTLLARAKRGIKDNNCILHEYYDIKARYRKSYS